ncbi:MAG: acyltransferase family protein [Halobacteriovoraceae bacterium]|jgi:glucans biosynthesis protein C|nr:acyltransferase family protein [Halobacteriovoraceae bacterium]
MNNSRVYAFDLIRALAAILVIIFHAGLPYLTNNISPWMITDPVEGSKIVDLTVWLSHRFQMHLFFIMSGYFANQVIAKKGLATFFTARIKKIFIPLLIGGIILLPLIVEFFEKKIIPAGIFNGNFQNPYRIENWSKVLLAHLWYLYYLMGFSLLLIPMVKFSLLKKLGQFFQANSKLALIMFCSIVFSIHLMMNSPLSINDTLSFKIDWLVFGYYFVFFCAGYLINEDSNLEKISELPTRVLVFTSGASAVVSLILITIKNELAPSFSPVFMDLMISVTTTIYCLAILLAIFNTCYKSYNQKNVVFSYLSDASYAVYIVHLPFVILFQRMAYFWQVPALLKWGIVGFATLACSFLFYQLIVRYSPIGTFLHGKRAFPSA